MTELNELSGDVADLLDYRIDEHGFHPAIWLPPVGRSCIVITCEVAPPRRDTMGELEAVASNRRGGILHPSDAADVFPDIATGERCGTCYSNDRLIEIGYSCPDEWHDGPIESDWRRIAAYISGIAVIGVWLLALFLYAAGVIK